MSLPPGLIPSVPPLHPLTMVNLINQHFTAIYSSSDSPTAPTAPVDGQIWLDASSTSLGKILKIRVDGAWIALHTAASTQVFNLNTAVTPGMFKFGPGVTGSGSTSSTAGTLIVTADGNGVTQLAMRQALNENNMLLIRVSPDTGATWTDWRRVFTQADIVGTVSHTSGIPTGAIIESDTLSSGTYVRYADGTQFCWAERTLTRADGGQLDDIWSVPRTFVNSSFAVFMTPGALNIAGNAAMLAAPRGFASSASQATLVIRRVNGQTDFASGNTITCSALAAGRWRT